MFFTYLRRELRRRMRQAVFIALGLALGVGLVITVTAASAGDELQGRRDRQRAGRRQPLGRVHPARGRAEPGRPEEPGEHHLRHGQQLVGHQRGERGLTMVVVTHDSTIARRAQRIGVMKNGRLNFKQPARAPIEPNS